MRFDYIITAIARLAIAQAREVRDVVFGGSMDLHEWLAYEPLGKPGYSGSLMSSSMGDQGTISPSFHGMKRSNLCQSHGGLAANCPAGIAAV